MMPRNGPGFAVWYRGGKALYDSHEAFMCMRTRFVQHWGRSEQLALPNVGKSSEHAYRSCLTYNEGRISLKQNICTYFESIYWPPITAGFSWVSYNSIWGRCRLRLTTACTKQLGKWNPSIPLTISNGSSKDCTEQLANRAAEDIMLNGHRVEMNLPPNGHHYQLTYHRTWSE